MRYTLVLTTVLTGAAPVLAAEPVREAVEIPLEEIWALDMPGTRDVRELNAPDDPIVESVLKNITESEIPKHGYVVRGAGADALREFLRVRADKAYWNRLPADAPLSIVFFTTPIREDAEIVSVTRRGKSITLRYRYAPRESTEQVPQLAVVPLGEVPVGDVYVVKVERMPAEQRHLDAGFEDPPQDRLEDVRMSCAFDAVEGPGGPPPPAEVMEIPLDTIWAYRMPGTRDINEFGSPDAEKSLVEKVLRQIRETWHHRHGMAVTGEGREALENLYRKRTEKQEWSEVAAGVPISLAFYTRGTLDDVWLSSVERRGNKFTIRYRLIPSKDRMSNSTIALIPTGRLEPGRYSVSIERMPLDDEFIEQKFRESPPERTKDICVSFGFVVVEGR